MIYQEFRIKGRKYKVLPYVGICCRELGVAQIYKFSCVRAQFLLCTAAR